MAENKQPDADDVRVMVGEAIERYSGQKVAGREDGLVGRDFRITGGDAIDMVEEIEARYGIDLHPFFDARTTSRKGWLRSRPVVADATVREFAHAIVDAIGAAHGVKACAARI